MYYLRVYFLSQSTYKNIFYFSPDDGESDDRHLSEQPMTSINNSRLKIKGSTSGKSMSIINDFGKAMMYNCEPCGKLLNGAKAKNQHDRLVHSKVLYLIVLLMYDFHDTTDIFGPILQCISVLQISDVYLIVHI